MGFIADLKKQGYILVRSRRWKKFLSKLYGWGASVVILGALFKINHYQYADVMLLIGLGTEAIIFFFSAFEPPYTEPDWSVIYPELTESYHGKEVAKNKGITKQGGPVRQLNDMLNKANIDDTVIDKLGDKLSDVSGAVLASNEYTKNVNAAATSMDELNGAYQKTSASLNKDVEATNEFTDKVKTASGAAGELAKTYTEASQMIKTDLAATEEFAGTVKNASKSAQNLADNYTRSAEKITKSADALDFSGIEGASYNEQLSKIANNLSSLNQIYELQLQSSNQQVQSSAKLHETMNMFLENMTESADKMIAYKQNMDDLNQKMAALNKVYGNMLSAMNVNK